MNTSPYQTGLGPHALRRIRIVFVILIFSFFAVSGSMVYAGVKTGEFERKIITPTKNFISAVVETFEEASREEESDIFDRNVSETTTDSSSEVRVEINNVYTATASGTTQKQYFRQYNITPIPTIDYQKQAAENQKAIDDWWAQVQAENKAKSAESQKQLEEFRQESQQNLQEFQSLGQKCSKEFSENNGQYVSQECKDFWNK